MCTVGVRWALRKCIVVQALEGLLQPFNVSCCGVGRGSRLWTKPPPTRQCRGERGLRQPDHSLNALLQTRHQTNISLTAV